MEIRLRQEDIDVLDSGKKILPNDSYYGYVGGEFTTNPNDCVEVLIYDTNDNFLESSIADVDDYYLADGAVKLNTGTILRKLGYDRGRYVVKYNFLRKLAGSDETVLVDENGTIHTDYHRMDGGRLMSGTEHSDTAVDLFVKENKYFIEEISPSRTEIRVVPQNISNDKYLNDFLKVQTGKSRINITSDAKFKVDAQGDSLAGDSLSLVFNDENIRIPQSVIGGSVSLNGSFVESVVDLTPPDIEAERADEIDSAEILPRFIISDDSAISGRYIGGDRNFTLFYEAFTGTGKYANTTEQQRFDAQSRFGSEVGVDTTEFTDDLQRPLYNYVPDSPTVITLKSISARPGLAGNIPMIYTWEISGWDIDSDDRYDRVKPGDDVDIDGAPAGSLRHSGTDLKEITIRLKSQNCTYGVKLKIDYPAEAKTGELFLPTCIRQDRS
jgi:hypothetical protein